MAQRLVRRICNECKRAAPLSADQLLSLSIQSGSELAQQLAGTAEGAGCVACRGTGYRGRVGVFELLDFDAELGEGVLAERTEMELRADARRRGLRTLRTSALARLATTLTSYEEVMRIIGPGTT
jgi:general secretion pathway protein E